MFRELDDDELGRQLSTYFGYAARNPAASLEAWMGAKDFAPGDREWLERRAAEELLGLARKTA